MSCFTATTLFNVRGQVFAIAGGGSGPGEAIALALDANDTSKVFTLRRREASLKLQTRSCVPTTSQHLITIQESIFHLANCPSRSTPPKSQFSATSPSKNSLAAANSI